MPRPKVVDGARRQASQVATRTASHKVTTGLSRTSHGGVVCRRAVPLPIGTSRQRQRVQRGTCLSAMPWGVSHCTGLPGCVLADCISSAGLRSLLSFSPCFLTIEHVFTPGGLAYQCMAAVCRAADCFHSGARCCSSFSVDFYAPKGVTGSFGHTPPGAGEPSCGICIAYVQSTYHITALFPLRWTCFLPLLRIVFWTVLLSGRLVEEGRL